MTESGKNGRDEFEGFFSKSAFRSGYFIAAGGACVGTTAYDVVIIYRHWQALSTFDTQALFVVAGILIGFLWMSLAQHSLIRELYREKKCVSDINRESALALVLRVTARTTNSMVFYCSLGVLLLLVSVDQLLPRMPGR